ncbi:MAG: peptidoglycan editing factor PgeF [Bacillota bacterium]
MNLHKTDLGYELKTPEVTLFFGGVESQLPKLRETYPDFKFTRVKQVHSDVVVESKDDLLDYQQVADAHFSTAKNLALCVITADCVPALFYHQKTGTIAGVHAGWRGVANRILIKTIQTLKSRGIPASELEVIIGPHIQKNSFEVGLDVRDQILSSLGSLSEAEKAIYWEQKDSDKALVDLNLIVKAQLESEGISFNQVFDLHIDTVSDPFFHSHRRDKEKAGRQVSFICRTT